ncbi:MAG: OmpA family protein [Chitinophagaceae bacterium]|nr:OmpA family protein [Chitinophagaceae bacterium]
MKKLIVFIVAVSLANMANAQFIKRMADRAKNKMEQKAGEKVDKSIDDAVDGKPAEKKSSDKKTEKDDVADNTESASGSTTTAASDNSNSTPATPSLKTYSKYDFIPGDKVIAYEDFSNTEIGDFPTRWNTNATAEIVTISEQPGHWMKLEKKGTFHAEFVTDLPQNFTFEFDVAVNDDWNSYPIGLNFFELTKDGDYTRHGAYFNYDDKHVVYLNFKPSVVSSRNDGASAIQTDGDGGPKVYNNVTFSNWDNKSNKFGHISVWRQNQRLRVYLNGQKIWDIPKAFHPTGKYNALAFGVTDAYRDGDFFLLNNMRLAVGAPDTRNKLITEGKFVTRGILFDVNSDVVKAESYGTIKDIANVLKENAGVKVKIVGHTDSDGDDKANLDLSKRRAESVKNALTTEFGIDASRIETDGKGESQPVDKSDTPVGKANNRRVEFIKL